MAEKIDWSKIDQNDPRFYEADPDNPNTNISASKYDPTDPTSVGNPLGEKYNEFLRTANIGDTFDWGKESGDPTQKGLVNKFIGFNKIGSPMIQTIQSEERQNWRQTMSGARSFQEAVNLLKDAGFSEQFASTLVRQSGTEFNTGTSSSSSATTNPAAAFNPATGLYTASDGKTFSDAQAFVAYEQNVVGKKEDRESAYNVLYNEFNKYGLGSLVEGIKGLVQSNISPSQFAIELQNTKEYQQRFKANQDRIAKGLTALTPAEYIGLEDQYQNIMRNYGLPASYYSKDTMGTQEGFQKFIGNDVSASELEDRIATAQQRVINSNPEVMQALKQFYPDISNADILSYALDPSQALTNIKRKVTAAEIGGAALAQGLQASGGTAESLAGLGITKQQAQQGYTDIAGILPRGSQLADIYGQQAYTQGTAEAEVFNTAGAADAAARRKKLSSLETAQFSGSSGVGALGRDKAIYGAMQGQAGLY